MAKARTLADFVKKWQAGMGGAGANWLAGAQATQVDPTAAAAAPEARQKAMQNYQQAMADGGRAQQGLQRSGRAGWLAGIQAAGASALTNGARKGAAKLNGPVGQQLFAAQQAAAAAAASAGSSGRARHEAAVNAMRAAFGKGPYT